jgi:hypothetical protein
MRSPGPWRIVVPDFELDLGLLPWLELDLDGAYAVEGPQTGPFSLDHAAPDSLWPCAKVGLYGFHDDDTKSGAGLGLQVGPKLPTGPQRGLGVEALVLLGGVRGAVTAALNFGAFLDPAPDAVSRRPRGLEVGIDLELAPNDLISLTGELAAVHFTSTDPDQLQASVGAVWAANANLDLSLTGLLGTLSGGDRYGILLGVSPKVRLFH